MFDAAFVLPAGVITPDWGTVVLTVPGDIWVPFCMMTAFGSLTRRPELPATGVLVLATGALVLATGAEVLACGVLVEATGIVVFARGMLVLAVGAPDVGGAEVVLAAGAIAGAAFKGKRQLANAMDRIRV